MIISRLSMISMDYFWIILSKETISATVRSREPGRLALSGSASSCRHDKVPTNLPNLMACIWLAWENVPQRLRLSLSADMVSSQVPNYLDLQVLPVQMASQSKINPARSYD